MAGEVTDRRYWRTPLDDGQVERTEGEIHILAERCKGCEYCVEYCPLDVLQLSSRFNMKGYHPPEVTKRDTCVACHLCEVICPEFAIFVQEKNKTPDDEALPVKEVLS